MKLLSLLFAFSLLFATCTPQKETVEPIDEAQRIVDSAIAFHGLHALNNANLSFKFRTMDYTYDRDGGMFTYTRTQTDEDGAVIIDSLSNEGLNRWIDGVRQELSFDRDSAFTASVNSVIYFTLLPFNLNDAAVEKEYLGITPIKDKEYHEVKVTFEQEGGGTDFEDVYLYWFDTEDYSMDYMAYLYYVSGGGIRFRSVSDSERIEGVLFQNYINYKPAVDSIDFMQINELFEAGELVELSRIINENIEITLRSN